MKKLLLSFVLLSGYQLQAAESHGLQAEQADVSVVRLQLHDGATIVVPRSFVNQLKTISNMLEDLPESDEAIPLPNQFITAETLQQLEALVGLTTQGDVITYLRQLNLLQLVYLYNANHFLNLTKTFTNGDNPHKNLDDILLEKIAGQLITTDNATIDPHVFQAINANNNLLIYIIEELQRRAWQVTRTLQGHARWLDSAAFSPDGQFIITGSVDNTAKVWNTLTGLCLHTLQGHTNTVTSAAFSPDGQFIITGSVDNTAKVWYGPFNHDRYQLVGTLQGHTDTVNSAAFSQDNQLIITGSADNTAKVWNARTGVCVRTLEGHASPVTSAAFSPDGQLIVTASFDDTARVWNARTGQLVHTLQGHTSWASSVAFSPDGQLIVTASFDDTARVWNARTGQLVRTLEGHTNAVYSAAFNRDGSLIVTGSSDRTAKVWDVLTGACIATLQGHTDSIKSAAFSPDGQSIVTGSLDRTAKLWTNNFAKAGLTAQQALTFSIEDALHIFKTGERPVSKIPAAESKPE